LLGTIEQMTVKGNDAAAASCLEGSVSARELMNVRGRGCDFTFAVASHRHVSPRFVAESLSPRTCQLRPIDDTINELSISVEDPTDRFKDIVALAGKHYNSE
jgi:hypothetical protein